MCARIIMSDWKAYLICNDGATYVGVSPDPVRRLRQHNGEICGGAKYTTGRGPGWKHACIVSGFRAGREAMQFEWAWKHVPPRGAGGLRNRLSKLGALLEKERWTSNAPMASEVPLTISLADEAWPVDWDPPPHVRVRRAGEHVVIAEPILTGVQQPIDAVDDEDSVV